MARFLFLVGHTGFRESYARRERSAKAQQGHQDNRDRMDKNADYDNHPDDMEGATIEEIHTDRTNVCPEEEEELFSEGCFLSKYV